MTEPDPPVEDDAEPEGASNSGKPILLFIGAGILALCCCGGLIAAVVLISLQPESKLNGFGLPSSGASVEDACRSYARIYVMDPMVTAVWESFGGDLIGGDPWDDFIATGQAEATYREMVEAGKMVEMEGACVGAWTDQGMAEDHELLACLAAAVRPAQLDACGVPLPVPELPAAIGGLQCSGGRRVRIVDLSEGGREERCEWSSGDRDGEAREWDADGNLVALGDYDDGYRAGEWRTWHSNGVLASQGRYFVSKKKGEWKTWHPNGQLESHLRYHEYDPVLQGRQLWFNADGSLRRAACHTTFDSYGSGRDSRESWTTRDYAEATSRACSICCD